MATFTLTFTLGHWTSCRDGECKCSVVMAAEHPVATVTRGEWGDDFPAVRIVGSSPLNSKAEAYMERIAYGYVDDATAAAPDLYEALDHITDLFVSLRPLGDDTEREMAVINARAALAKAAA